MTVSNTAFSGIGRWLNNGQSGKDWISIQVEDARRMAGFYLALTDPEAIKTAWDGFAEADHDDDQMRKAVEALLDYANANAMKSDRWGPQG